MTIPELLPFYCNAPMGEVLLGFAQRHPHVSIQVFCGHTHSPCRLDLGNSSVETLPGKSGTPRIERVSTIDEIFQHCTPVS